MEKKRASKRFTIIITVLTAAMILFAWIHSFFPADMSSTESGGVLSVVSAVLGVVGIGEELTDHIIRKAAHFTEFFAIGALLLSCAYCFDRFRPYRYLVYVLSAGLFTAVVDETIQLGSEGRSGMITAVWIDLGGVVCGAALMLGVYALYKKAGKIK